MIEASSDEILWVQKYRPQKIADTILPEDIKHMFQTYVDGGDIPNLLLVGSPGTGKTTVAKAMLKEIDADYISINGSLNGGIDTLRYDIQKFASTVSFSGQRKFVLIDEADFLNCLGENETILLTSGEVIELKDMKDDIEYRIISFNTSTSEFEEDIAQVVNRLEKEAFEIELDDGSTLVVTDDHPFIVKSIIDGSISQRTIKDGFDGYDIVLK